LGGALRRPVGLAGTTVREIGALRIAHPPCDSLRLIELLVSGAE